VDVEYLVVIGIAIMSLMALVVILFVLLYQRRVIRHQAELQTIESQRQMELLQASLQSEEEERRRIAAELHDDIGATLASARLYLHQAEKTAVDPAMIQQSGQLVDDSIRKVREVSHKLQPATLETLGLPAALEALADVYARSKSLNIVFERNDSVLRLSSHVELHIYRIVQELINNLVRHAAAKKVILAVLRAQDGITIELRHDGKGLSQTRYEELLHSKSGIGLKNINNRVRFITGSIHFTENVSGHSIQLNVPLK
jgi:two-component system, NarL family, sensor kinase